MTPTPDPFAPARLSPSRSLAWWLAAMLVAGVAGAWVARHLPPRALAQTPAGEADAAALRQKAAALRDELERLRAAPAPPAPAAADAPGGAPPRRYQAILQTLAHGGVIFEMPALFDGGALSANFTRLFELAPEETRTLNAAFAEARQRAAEAMAAHATIVESDGQLTVNVASFENGEDTYRQIAQVLRDTLGEERYRLFAAIPNHQLEHAFRDIGRMPRVLHISRESSPESPGGSRLVLQDRSSRGRPTAGAVPLNLADLPLHYFWLERHAARIDALQPVAPAVGASP